MVSEVDIERGRKAGGRVPWPCGPHVDAPHLVRLWRPDPHRPWRGRRPARHSDLETAGNALIISTRWRWVL